MHSCPQILSLKYLVKWIFVSVAECIWKIVQERIGQPLPTTSIFANERLLGDNSEEASYQIREEDVSKEVTFTCDWRQVGPGGEELYRGRETSQTVSIVLPPVLDNRTIQRWFNLYRASYYRVFYPTLEVLLREWLSECDHTFSSLPLGIQIQGVMDDTSWWGNCRAHIGEWSRIARVIPRCHKTDWSSLAGNYPW